MNECEAILEYVWIDGFNNLRSKIKITKIPKYQIRPGSLPEWNFDGSSTGQASGFKSDVILKPVAVYNSPFKYAVNDDIIHLLVLCDTYNPDGTPHVTNNRVKCLDTHNKTLDHEALFGIEQEYIIYDARTDMPFGWLNGTLPSKIHMEQGPFYCSAGGDVTFGREICSKHMSYCLKAGLAICGTNAEVTPSQWEFQIGPLSAIDVSDQLWIARYILNRVAESFGCYIKYHPKPMKEWNGSGCHTNFSTKLMREKPMNSIDRLTKEITEKEEHAILTKLHPHPPDSPHPKKYHVKKAYKLSSQSEKIKNIAEYVKESLQSGKFSNESEMTGGIYEIEKACKKLEDKHTEHIAVYGNVEQNRLRLTGHHETASMDKFTWGVSDRGASIRIPLNVSQDQCGYLEDRRPASNMDPYLVTSKLLETICLDE